MAKAPAVTGNKGLIWMAWLLSTAGFAILLGGVASMQQVCGAGRGAEERGARPRWVA